MGTEGVPFPLCHPTHTHTHTHTHTQRHTHMRVLWLCVWNQFSWQHKNSSEEGMVLGREAMVQEINDEG